MHEIFLVFSFICTIIKLHDVKYSARCSNSLSVLISVHKTVDINELENTILIQASIFL